MSTPLPPAPGAVRVAINALADGEPIANILHFVTGSSGGGIDTTAWSAADLATLVNLIKTEWEATFRTNLSSDYVLTSYVGTDLTSNTGLQDVVLSSAAGTGSPPTAPNSACLVVSFKIARRYRGGHPRMYLSPFVQAGQHSARSWSTSIKNAVGTSLGTFVAALAGTTIGSRTPGVALVCVSYRSGNALRSPNALVEPIIGTTVDSRICSQRRRLGKSLTTTA